MGKKETHNLPSTAFSVWIFAVCGTTNDDLDALFVAIDQIAHHAEDEMNTLLLGDASHKRKDGNGGIDEVRKVLSLKFFLWETMRQRRR